MVLEVGNMKVTSDDVWPPGFRFHPTDEELVLYYLKKKICKKRIKVDVIAETDVYKWDPEELPGQSLLKNGDRQWFFFTPRDRKYPNGARSNRATRLGYWKATGKDRIITCGSRNVGLKKTLVFYRGRAPNGERMDWVMHEYTLDEEELKRCQNVQDYYALYKVFKKSGPGPKNGEQYGAPFKEEDWNDDDCLDVSKTVDPEIPVKQPNEVDPVSCVRAHGQVPFVFDDHEFEELMKQFTDDPVPPDLQIDHAYEAPQVFGEEEAQSTLLNPSSREIIFPMPSRCNEQASFDFTLSASSNLQPFETPEVTSAPKNCEQALQFCEDDFLEMDDLMGSETAISNVEKPVENLQFDELNELELFHDAAMFLHDLGPVGQEEVMNMPGNNAVNQADHQIQPHSVANQMDQQLPQDLVGSQVVYQFHSQSAVNPVIHQLQPNLAVNQVDYQFQAQSAVNLVPHQLQPNLPVDQVDYQLQSHLPSEDQFSSQLWMHHQQSNISTLEELNQANLCPPPSGVVHESTDSLAEANQNQGAQEGGAASSWFSSSLWSFVESIPSTPASASENPLVNRALERMSSFSRMRLNARNINVAGSATALTRRQAGSSNRGFLILSILGILCAILWMLMGNVRVLWRCISS